MDTNSIKLACEIVYNTIEQTLKGPIKDIAIQIITKENGLLCAGMVVAPLAAIAVGMGINAIFMRVFNSSPSAPTKILPNGTWHVMEALTFPGDIVCSIAYTILSILPLKESQLECLMEDFIGPVLEEFEWRWFVQKIVLTVVPGLILGACCPAALPFLNSTTASVARVVLSAGIFALTHTDHWGNGGRGGYSFRFEPGVNPQFVAGLLLGSVYAYTGLLYPGMIMHIIHNLTATIFDNYSKKQSQW